jgi:leucyl aminopeptidase
MIKLIDKKINAIEASEIILVKSLKDKYIKDAKLLKSNNFSAKNEEISVFIESSKVYVGIEDFDDYDSIRVGVSLAFNKLKLNKNIKIASYVSKCSYWFIRAVVEGVILGSYSFDKYKSEKNKINVKNFWISTESYLTKKLNVNDAKEAIKEATIISTSTNFTRDIVNEIPNNIYPKTLAKIAKDLAKSNNLICNILKEEDLKKENMNAFLAVGRASINPSRLIHLSYKGKNAKKNVVLVGKGLTYDSGGLSLKPADYMVTMKSDKSGACAVLGIIKAVSELKLDINLDVFIGAAENMIGGNAYKPDDVLIAKNKKTIEVRNTDAEGRLVLADTLCYAQEQIKKIDYILDYATLTGACVVAVGPYTSGLMGYNDALKSSFKTQAAKSGELTAPLEFNKYLEKKILSKIADLSNTGEDRYAGAQTAGIFLSHFLTKENKTKWMHIDIAGPAYRESAWGYNPAGGSGAGVRMTLAWIGSLIND